MEQRLKLVNLLCSARILLESNLVMFRFCEAAFSLKKAVSKSRFLKFVKFGDFFYFLSKITSLA